MKVTARINPYSSVVGQSISLVREDGTHLCQLPIVGLHSDVREDHKRKCAEIAQQIADRLDGMEVEQH